MAARKRSRPRAETPPHTENATARPHHAPPHGEFGRSRRAALQAGLLQAFALLVLVAFTLYPALPETLFHARNPAQPSAPFLFFRSHAHFGNPIPFHLAWGLEGARRVPAPVRALPLLAAATLIGLYWRRRLKPPGAAKGHAEPAAATGPTRGHGPPRALTSHALTLALMVSAALFGFGLFTAGKVSYAVNRTFGDGKPLTRDLELDARHAAEPLTMEVAIGLKNIVRRSNPEAPPEAILALASRLAGALFLAGLVLFARVAGRDRVEQAALFLGPATAGSVVMFFGYVETTYLELAVMAWFAATAAGFLRASGWPARTLWAAGLCLSAGAAVTAHAAGVALLPALGAAFVLAGWRAAGGRWLQGLRRAAIDPRHWAFFLLFTVLPYYQLVLKRYYLRGSFGNVKGGGDGIPFVPLSVDYLARPSPFVLYPMFSTWHALDIASAVLACAPFALLVPLVLGPSLWRRHADIARPGAATLSVLGVAAVCCLSIPLTWNHDFGMWGDWNIAGAYLFPANLLGWAMLVRFLGLCKGRRPWLSGVAAPLLLAQLAAALMLLLQFTDSP